MNEQKIKGLIYFFLGMCSFLIPPVVAISIVYDKGMSFLPVLMFTFTVVWAGLFWLFPFVAERISKAKKKVTFDERDQSIHKRAVMVAYAVLWLYFVAACVIAWCMVGPQGSISVNVMPLTLVGGLAIFLFVQSLATLIQEYGESGREGKGEQS